MLGSYFLARRRPGFLFRLHGQRRAQHGHQLQRFPPTTGGLGLAQECQSFAQFPQVVRLAFHAPGDPLHRPEQIDQHRHGRWRAVGAHRVFEQHRGAALGQQPGLNFSHFQMGGNRLGHPHQLLRLFQPFDEIAQRRISHPRHYNLPIRFTWPTNGHDLLARNYTGLIFFYITEHHRGAGHDPRQAPGQDPHHQATEEIGAGVGGIAEDRDQGA